MSLNIKKKVPAGEVASGPVLTGPDDYNTPNCTTPGRVATPFDGRVQQGQFAVRTWYQDGHHPDDRDNLIDNQIGVVGPGQGAHEHDDWKRSPPEIIDQSPGDVRRGVFGEKRIPLSGGDTFNKTPGDQLPVKKASLKP